MPSRKRAGVTFIASALVFFVLFSITIPAKSTTESVATAPVFDVPVLVGKDLDDVTQVLGTANKDNTELTAEQLPGAREWSKSWEKNGQELLVTYSTKTGVITDFFLPSSDRFDTKDLLTAGNLNENDPAYRVEFVKALSGGGYTGVKVTPR